MFQVPYLHFMVSCLLILFMTSFLSCSGDHSSSSAHKFIYHVSQSKQVLNIRKVHSKMPISRDSKTGAVVTKQSRYYAVSGLISWPTFTKHIWKLNRKEIYTTF